MKNEGIERHKFELLHANQMAIHCHQHMGSNSSEISFLKSGLCSLCNWSMSFSYSCCSNWHSMFNFSTDCIQLHSTQRKDPPSPTNRRGLLFICSCHLSHLLIFLLLCRPLSPSVSRSNADCFVVYDCCNAFQEDDCILVMIVDKSILVLIWNGYASVVRSQSTALPVSLLFLPKLPREFSWMLNKNTQGTSVVVRDYLQSFQKNVPNFHIVS